MQEQDPLDEVEGGDDEEVVCAAAAAAEEVFEAGDEAEGD